MSPKLRNVLLIVGIWVAIDILAWQATYRAATAPSPEEVQLAAAATPTLTASSVEARFDGFEQIVSLDGPWRFRQTGSEMDEYFSPDLDVSAWHTMNIPQNWYLAGLNYHGTIWFRREFEASADWQGRAVRLRFDGVDYFADVWLNGRSLGHHEGYFQPFTYEVSEYLNYGGNNILVVRVESPYEEYGSVWPYHKTLIKGALGQHNARPGGERGRAGQEYNTGGIWNAVSLVVSDFAGVESVRIQASWPTSATVGQDAAVNAAIALRNDADITVEAAVSLTLIPRNFEGEAIALPSQSVTLSRGETEVVIRGVAPHPQLWWTWDRGNPNLYTARIEVTADGALIAHKETTFGFRQVQVSEDWTWTLNGQRFFPRGSGYISDQWLSRTNRAGFQRDVQLMREANLNFIRVHAHVEPVAFYEVADELGILVWQDFPLYGGYSDAPAFVDEAQRQMRDMVQLLYNHPSIVVWCAHHEAPWASPQLADRMPDYSPVQNKRLDELLGDLARELDPTRYVHLNSGSGDAHVYPGWSSGHWTDFYNQAPPSAPMVEVEDTLPGAPFVTEYGAQALPNLDMMQAMFAPEELMYESGEVRSRWEFHDFQPLETFQNANIPQGESIEEFIASSQAYQANLIQFATESYRRAKYNPMQGIFYSMFVDSWPSITWSVLDYSRQPKQGFYALQTAMQPILPSIEAAEPARLEGRRWVYTSASDVVMTLWVVNDTLDEYPDAHLECRILNEEGKTVRVNLWVEDVLPDHSQRLFAIRPSMLSPGNYRLSVELDDAQGHRLGVNAFEFAIAPEEQP